MQDVIASLPFAFLTALVVSLIFYWIGGKIAPKGKKTADKVIRAYMAGIIPGLMKDVARMNARMSKIMK